MPKTYTETCMTANQGSESTALSVVFSFSPPLLKTELVVKKTGGTMLTINGAKADFGKNAFSGKKDKFVFAPVPSPVRGYSSPWLGPNLRLASEIQMIWTPAKLKTPCSIFLPFTFASALELTTEEATERAKTLIAAAGILFLATYAAAAAAAAKAAKEAAAAAAEAGAEGAEKPNKKKSVKHEKNKADYTALDVPILDTRTVFVLQAKIGDEYWTLKQNIVFVQPLIHYLEWPPQVLKAARMAGRFSEYKEPQKPAAPLPTDNANSPANKGAGGKNRKSAAKQPAEPVPEILPDVEIARRTEMLAGGICFEADEFNDFVAIVIATPSEAVEFDREGGLLRSPLLHPLLSVRIPKLCTMETRTSTFKVIDVRPDMMPSIHNFDPQLTEINECSPIYEMDLGLKPFERPVYLQLPLPNWYMDLIDKMLHPPESESNSGPDELATHKEGLPPATGAAEEGEKAEQKPGDENANNVIPLEKRPKNLLLLYQVVFIMFSRL
ncbi:unnamed protein product [Dibothriocephalus latus]|uniref:Uncharacterized protein n=1 Tax=Dibothriocephalus latus TaxID=60516 RepID=A0A3P7KV69_DIBLA|nr:unnamed protein product [Dibothriocephalus latus]